MICSGVLLYKFIYGLKTILCWSFIATCKLHIKGKRDRANGIPIVISLKVWDEKSQKTFLTDKTWIDSKCILYTEEKGTKNVSHLSFARVVYAISTIS